MYILTSMAGKKLCTGTHDKLLCAYIYGSLPKYCKLYLLKDGAAVYIRTFGVN